MRGAPSIERLRKRLSAPVDGSSLNVLRMALGALVTIGAVRFWAKGWVSELLVAPQHRFHYYGFSWVPRLGEAGNYALLGAVALFGVTLALGYRYRASALTLFVAFSWFELQDVSTYLNHYYLVSCLLLLLACLPAAQFWSLDVARGRAAKSDHVQRWVLWAVRTQVAVVYVFAGFAKLKSDWLLAAEPLRTWLFLRSDLPLIGPLLTHVETAYVFSWAGAFYDLFIVAFLLWRRTRRFAFLAVIAFHLMTGLLFNIGLFPWVMIALSTVFFSPAWPRRLFETLRAPWRNRASFQARERAVRSVPAPSSAAATDMPRWAAYASGTFLLFQLVLPLRQWAYPGNPLWTEQGYRFAWNVMLMEKAGHVEFDVIEPETGRRWTTSGRTLLTPAQYQAMSTQPDLILQFARILGDEYQRRHSLGRVSVFADAWASLNGRPRQRLIDPGVDLLHQKDSFAAKPWILPPL